MVRRNRTIKVSIPGGIDNGQTISMRGQGSAGVNGGEAGDLFVTVTIKRHEFFEREGTAVLLSLPVSFVQAALGAELEVPTLDGKVKYNVPAGTQTGAVFRLKNKGIQNLRGSGRGDQYITVNVQVPKSLTNEQKDLLIKFAEAGGDTVNTGKKRRR